MKDLIAKSFDFSIRIIEMANYLAEEHKQYPLMGRLLECGTGIGSCLRLQDSYAQAYRLSTETEYLLELLAKTGFVSELQIRPILTDCRFLKDGIEKQISKK